MIVLVDSNIWLDIVTEDPTWGVWSANVLARVLEHSRIAINPLIYAEVSVGFARIEEVEAIFKETWVHREAIPYEAGFLAGKAFLKYKKRGGQRSSLLPDFYIGAHAAVSQYKLLTRDILHYRTYFPTLELISPHNTKL